MVGKSKKVRDISNMFIPILTFSYPLAVINQQKCLLAH